MPSFKVPCPSCEAPVLIKNPNLVGTKVECPKCKYRFKVEEPATDAKDKKGDGKDKKSDAKKAAAGGKKKLVPILVGVGAVVVLAVVGIAVFGGGDKKKGGFVGPIGPGNNAGNNAGNTGTPDGQPPSNPDQVPSSASSTPISSKNTTHLLPGQTVAVYRFNLDLLQKSQAHDALIDSQVATMFKDSMGFPVSDVDLYIHCFAGDNRDPFGIIKLKTPTRPADVVTMMARMLQPKPKAVKGRNLHAMRANPFVTAVSAALSMRALFGDYYDQFPMSLPANKAKPQDKPLGVCVYDSQHILIGDYTLLDRFLGELDANGYPPFKTVLATAPSTPTPGAPPTPMPGTPGAAPVTPGKPATPPATPAAGSGDSAYTSVDAYRTIEYPLKKALDDLEADRNLPPMFVYAEKFDARQYDPKMLKKDLSILSALLDPIAARTRYLSANVVTFSTNRLVANLRVTLGSGDDARTIAKDQLSPGLATLAELLKLILTTPVEFRDFTQGGTSSGTGIPSYPGYPMGGPGPGLPPGLPPTGMGSPGGPGMPPGPLTTGGPGPGMPPGPPPMGFGTGPGPGMPPGPPPTGFGTGPGPGMPPGPPPMGFGPGMPSMGPDMTEPRPTATPASHVDLGMLDRELLIAIDLHWSEPVNRTIVGPRMMGIANQIKGKMAIFTSDLSWAPLAEAGRKALDDPERKAFPRGTWNRKSNTERFGLEYPPVQRVSLFVDLLPYMGHGQLASTVNKNVAWYDEKNLKAGGAWVPELLVPDYPQSAWRATSPYAPDHVLGATNYVAIAGVGLDIARVNPNDPAYKTKVGITGYGWGSKPEEVTDGLSNTIYMMQTPPGLQQPWIAGGGATVRGLDPDNPMAAFKYTQRGRTKQGTYALMGDGSVRFIPEDIDPKILRALATRAGDDNKDLADVDKLAPNVEAPKAPAELKADPKPMDKKSEEKKPDEKRPADPKAAEPKKEPVSKAPEGKASPAPPPADKK